MNPRQEEQEEDETVVVDFSGLVDDDDDFSDGLSLVGESVQFPPVPFESTGGFVYIVEYRVLGRHVTQYAIPQYGLVGATSLDGSDVAARSGLPSWPSLAHAMKWFARFEKAPIMATYVRVGGCVGPSSMLFSKEREDGGVGGVDDLVAARDLLYQESTKLGLASGSFPEDQPKLLRLLPPDGRNHAAFCVFVTNDRYGTCRELHVAADEKALGGPAMVLENPGVSDGASRYDRHWRLGITFY